MAKVKTGPYVVMGHEDDKIFVKTFENGKSYICVNADAFNAGIIGSERNGIAILSPTDGRIVTDEIMISRGLSANSSRESTFRSIKDMNFNEFAAFCTKSKNYKGGFPDLDNPSKGPGKPNLTLQKASGIDVSAFQKKGAERDIRLAATKMDDKNNAQQDGNAVLTTKSEIINHLLTHDVHKIGGPYSRFAFSWNIKFYNYDKTDKKYEEYGFTPDKSLDKQFERHLDWAFSSLLSELVSQYIECFDTGLADKKAALYTAGRSDGHMILTEFDGANLEFRSLSDMEEFLSELNNKELAALYHVVHRLDNELSRENIPKHVSHFIAGERMNYEEGVREGTILVDPEVSDAMSM